MKCVHWCHLHFVTDHLTEGFHQCLGSILHGNIMLSLKNWITLSLKHKMLLVPPSREPGTLKNNDFPSDFFRALPWTWAHYYFLLNEGPPPQMVYAHPPIAFVICSPRAFASWPRVSIFPVEMGKFAPEPSQVLEDIGNGWVSLTHTYFFFSHLLAMTASEKNVFEC